MAKAKIVAIKQKKKWVRFCVYAHPGSGKTVLASTAPRSIILNADGTGGTDSAAAHGSNADEWTIRNHQDLKDSFRYFKLSKEAKKKYRWVWLDSATLFQDLGMDDIMRALIAEKPHRDPDVPDVQEYLRNQTRLMRWVRDMKGLPYHLGITAHVMRVEDADGDVMYMPAIQGKQGELSSKLCGHMSVVGRLYVRKEKKKGGKKSRASNDVVWPGNVLQTTAAGKWYAKDRFDAIGGRMVNPTIPKIMAAIKLKFDGKTEEN